MMVEIVCSSLDCTHLYMQARTFEKPLWVFAFLFHILYWKAEGDSL